MRATREPTSGGDAGLPADGGSPRAERAHAGEALAFPIDAFRKRCLIESLDDIAYALTHTERIRAFEARRSAEAPWIFSGFTEVSP